MAKELYQIGAVPQAAVVLELYVGTGAAQPLGRHLLAHCLVQLREPRRALEQFGKCVAAAGFDEDWQMVVELGIELEEDEGEGA